MRRIDQVDMVLTSPPYDGIRDYNGYSFDFESTARGLYDVLKPGGVVVWVVGDETTDGSESGTSFRQALYFKEIGFKLWDTMIYYKVNPYPTTGKRYHQHFEYMFVFSKGNAETFNPITEPTKYRGSANYKNRRKNGSISDETRQRTATKKIGNVFFYTVGYGQTTSDKIAFQHPAIFPEQLATDQILTWSNPGDVIYDPFIGSGTTAKACLQTGRKYIGSEISADYCKIAEQRLSTSCKAYIEEPNYF